MNLIITDPGIRDRVLGNLAYAVVHKGMTLDGAREALRRSSEGRGVFMKHEITTNREFFTGGHAVFTISNPRGEHYTYRIQKVNNTGFNRIYGPSYFVHLLTGPDNTSSFTYLGAYRPDAGKLRLTKGSRLPADSKPVRVFDWGVSRVVWGGMLPVGYIIQHEGRCCRCGRRLTVPESIESGIGPECAKRAERGG